MTYLISLEQELRRKLKGLPLSKQSELIPYIKEVARQSYLNGHKAGSMVTEDNFRHMQEDISELLTAVRNLKQKNDN